MDQLERFRSIIRRILGEYLEYIPREEQIETLAVCDDAGGHYLLIEIGWQPPRRIYSVLFHIRLSDGKIRVEQDWTERGVAHDLIAAGVPESVIELGFRPPEIKRLLKQAAVPA
ncbi:MAG: XisI protein [Chloroflexi bacterium]|nr:XisI protein [Chloroflexota bacterium]